MNKKLTYIVAGVIVVALIVAAALYMNKSGGPAGGSPAAQSQTSLTALLAKGGSQKCTFSHEESGAGSSGTIYMSSGKMRGDFIAKVQGAQEVQSHMIVDGQTSYVWSDAMPQGVKMKFDAAATANATDPMAKGNIDPNQKANYDCSYWSADQSKFALPSGVTFMELGNPAAAAGAGTSAGANSAQCAQCNLISDSGAKAQCLAALSCN